MIKETFSALAAFGHNKQHTKQRSATGKNKTPASPLFAFVLLSLSASEVFAQEQPLVKTAQVKLWQNGADHSLHCQVQNSHLLQFSSLSRAKLNWVLPAGTRVKKGQLIAKQDGYFLEREIQQLQIDLASAKAEYNYAEKEFQRLYALDKQLVSPSTLNELQRRQELAKFAKARFSEQLKEANYRYQQLEHFAPQDGQLLALQAQPGQYLNVGDNITRLQASASKELVCELPLDLFRENQSLARVEFSMTREHKLTLLRSSNSVKANSQTLQLYLKAADEVQQQLLAGERLQVNISYQDSDLSLLPLDALELTREGSFAWLLGQDNKVKKTPVEVIASQKAYFVVKSGLQSGDRVVTIGKQGLAEQQQVSISGESNWESE
ncbi:efflux RND transporter periplasmic adaptor subunit [Thalassomonas actiniarum]|uniref:Efflux RND transporter periplasmic adaptor subunit n=1 Tax=Thalassomonas actiniarum TaxID=485447 RepID=A0AAE9YW82_9GAMM|nr:efflux RND transporter periplasmic adaptor subunit [Thalassomonas actiniarum]WDE01509.1 efflux RND transporter periplasmic adaptor subunit [Thalassomonas actiniarum]